MLGEEILLVSESKPGNSQTNTQITNRCDENGMTGQSNKNEIVRTFSVHTQTYANNIYCGDKKKKKKKTYLCPLAISLSTAARAIISSVLRCWASSRARSVQISSLSR